MNRFLIYLILINMLTNMVSITPRILITGSDRGTITGMIAALIIGMTLTYIIILLFSKFPGQGLPEILQTNISKWIATPVLLFFTMTWFFAGLTTLTIYTFIIIRFLTPEMSIYIIILTFVAVVTYGMVMSTRNIMYFGEIVFILAVPIIFFVQIKGYLSTNLNWDYIRIAIMEINHLPQYTSFASSLFIVVGAANLVIFNRFFNKLKKPTRKGMALLSFLCTYILATTYFLPIGFGGFDSLDNVLYPWIMTSDSIRMKFGIVERIFFFFTGAFLALGVVSMVMHWHVSLQLLSSVIHFKRFKWKSVNLTRPLFIIIYWIVATVTTKRITAEGLFQSVKIFDKFLLPIVLATLICSLLLANRRQQNGWKQKN